MRAFRSLFGRDPVNHYTADPNLRQILRFYLGDRLAAFEPLLRETGRLGGAEVEEVAEYTDKVARPRLVKWDVWGRPADEVWLNPAHRGLLEQLYRLGLVARPFREDVPWHVPYAQGYLVADPGVYCSVTVTLATAYTVFKYAGEPARSRYLPHLVSTGEVPVYQGATWVTEVQGGSDVGANRTVARRDGDRWRLYGEKYFASNVGAEVALVTARLEEAPAGAKGVSLFLVPRYLEDGRSNYSVRRLKDKLGTNAVPTGEVVLDGTEAELVGRPEHGIYYTLEMLTLSRLSNIIGAAGIARRALHEVLTYITGREAFGRRLQEHPLMQAEVLDLLTEAEAAASLAFYTVDLFERAWRDRPPYSEDYHFMRLVSHLAKQRTAEHATLVARRGLEIHGGIGFLEEFPFARWLREALVTPIWEGTPQIQALDLLEVIAKKGSHGGYFAAVGEMLDAAGWPGSLAQPVRDGLATVRRSLECFGAEGQEYAAFHARSLLELMADVLSAALLLREARWLVNTEGDGRKLLVARWFVERRLKPALDRGMLERARWPREFFGALARYEPVPARRVLDLLATAPVSDE